MAIVFAPLLIYVAAFAITFTIPYFKVTDPNDPRFKPENFRFEDYFWIHGGGPGVHRNQKVHDAIYATFKKGMSKKKVDEILVGKLRCSSKDITGNLDDITNPEIIQVVKYYCDVWWSFPWWLQNPVDGLWFPIRAVQFS